MSQPKNMNVDMNLPHRWNLSGISGYNGYDVLCRLG
jgi:hypothetical protein